MLRTLVVDLKRNKPGKRVASSPGEAQRNPGQPINRSRVAHPGYELTRLAKLIHRHREAPRAARASKGDALCTSAASFEARWRSHLRMTANPSHFH